MKKLILLLIMSSCLVSCTTYSLNKSVWFNLSSVEEGGQEANITTSLHFVSEEQVNVFVSVISDTNVIVTPFKYAEGTYKVNGNPKKEAKIDINLTTIEQNKDIWTGYYHKNDGMVLQSSDKVVKIYGKLPDITLP